METMPNWLHKRAQMTPERVAIIENGTQVTYKELQKKSVEVANGLRAEGIDKGQHIGFFMQNSLEAAVCLHALMYIGAVIVPLNHRLTAAELSFQLDDAELTYVIADDELVGKTTDALNDSNVSLLVYQQVKPGSQDLSKLEVTIELDQLHTIMYTSGTTGKPKGVMLTYGNHWWSAISSSLNLGHDVHDRWLCAVPMFHMSGLSILLRSVIYGITMIIKPRFEPHVVNQSIQQEGVTIVSVVSAMLSRMLDDLGGASYPSTLRCVLLGGGPAPYPLLTTCERKGIPVFQTFGMTETASQLVTLSPEYMLLKQGSAGKALFPSEVLISDNDNVLSPGEHGEILVKGPTVTSGYWKRNEATHEALRNGWLHTGDIGYMDEDGFLFVLDRRKDLIISGGENVYPAEIESALLEHHAVKDAGVTGIQDEKWGEVPVAFVVKDELDLSSDALLAFLSERLASYKLPKWISFVDELPRNGANKLQRNRLNNTRETNR
ncbi:o-succinylbenzoate--CoA ligase [Pseudalkalibacillus hwajinpoensis]|uniref:2-succinylbenzoate--CoA ligase n=1 Tax=Guptibacillus hwajinpoensis TaxID=208199 RepID=A0A4U1MFT1_9BACL|nr:o-succinylbenzoate--CoA ligase [Pseudalkalibacillus hwajinpoensis]TKD69164.1 o-succinylbenzoate--CoA ligase [Pseudalkalibacillus hwajinpoensis]